MSEDNFWAHVHLMVNDVPIIGFSFAAIFLVAALTTSAKDSWARAGMLTLGLSFLGLVLAFVSGDPALKVINGQPRTSARALTEHHVRGLFAVGFALITIGIAIVASVKARRAGGIYSRKVLLQYLLQAYLQPERWYGLARQEDVLITLNFSNQLTVKADLLIHIKTFAEMKNHSKKERYHIEGMTCSGCERTVSKVVGNIEGVLSSKADLRSSTLSVEYDPSKVTREKIRNAVNGIGYKFVGEQPVNGRREGSDQAIS